MKKNLALNSDPIQFTRREWLWLSALGTMAYANTVPAVVPADAAEESSYTPRNRFPRMVHEYYVQQVREAEKRNIQEKSKINNKDKAEAYVRDIHKRVQECFGPWPEKTPLNPRITKTIERDEYTIENVIFESRPNFLVTGNLYIPKNRDFPLPGVVGTCGHSSNGKAYEGYQAFAQGLAKMGYVVLLYDPLGQGERLQYVDEDLKSKIGVGVREHLYAGNQQFLVGEFIGSWRAWDGIRALDYLLTREEVEPNQVGVTGNSGGGTMTTWLCGVESRWSMAAPSCFVTTFRRNMENELPADTEQCPPQALALGLDHCDFLLCMAPKPVIILAKEKDYFDVRGSIEAQKRLQKIYELLDAKDNIGLFVGPTYHGYSQENREAMYRWFNDVTQISNRRTEPNIQAEDDETLWCAPKGQVSTLGSRTVFSFTKEKSERLKQQRKALRGEALKQSVTEMLRLPERKHNPYYRILRPHSSDEYPLSRAAVYAVNTEPGIHALVYRLSDDRLYSRPPKIGQPALLYVSHHSSDAELRTEEIIRKIMEEDPESVLYACDVRGVGESRPGTTGNEWLDPYGSDYFYAIHSLMMDAPYVGRKTHDLLTVLDWLKGNGHSEIHILANGWGTVPATFAALLSKEATRVTLQNPPTSYTEIAENEMYGWPLSSFIPNVLSRFDLTDCYGELKSKQLQIV